MKQADANTRVPMAAPGTRKTRRVYPRDFKLEVIAQCLEPGASVSAIALGHGINANVIRKWLPREKLVASRALATMLPVTIRRATSGVPSKPAIHSAFPGARPPIEVSLGAAIVRLPPGFDPAELRSIVQVLSGIR